MPLVETAYNSSAGTIWDLAEALAQMREGINDDDPDLLTHLNQYRLAINAGRKVVVVAHSQGNLYANHEYGKLAAIPILPIDRHFSIVAVATPAVFVAGNGPYVTLLEDLFASVGFLFALVPNTSNFPICGYSRGCHHFLSAYLSGRVSGPRIVGHILAALPPATPGPTASIVFSNLGPGNSFGGIACGIPFSFPAGFDFITPPGQLFELSSIEIAAQVTGTPFDGDLFSLRLQADGGGFPSTVLEVFNPLQAPVNVPAIVTATSVSRPRLQPSTRYWVIVAAGTPSVPIITTWMVNSIGDTGLNSGCPTSGGLRGALRVKGFAVP
jgi:hypothetical protein